MTPAAATLDRFDTLIRTDPTVAPLAALQAIAFRAAAAPHWSEGLPALQGSPEPSGQPLLHGARLAVRPDPVRQLLLEMSRVAARMGSTHGDLLHRARSRLDVLAILKASIEENTAQLERMAGEAEVELDLLATLGHLVLLPLLQACGRQAQPLLQSLAWQPGYCPLCAAWPTLAELRGLERRRWLRCGRCAAAWEYPGQQCLFCGNKDHRTLGYLAAEGEQESQQATTCDACHGYLKSFATIGALAAEEIALKDLTSLELDLVALEQGYARPATLGFPLRVQLDPIERKQGWVRWRR